MSNSTAQNLQHELNSLQGLSVINILASAMALAFGAYYLMPNLIAAAQTGIVDLNRIGLIILGALAFVIALRWLISSAKIIDIYTKLAKSLTQHKEDNTLDEDGVTGLIVNMAAAYRENKSTLKLMITISKIAGVCFAIAGALAIINIVTGLLSAAPLWLTVAMTANMAISLATSAACFIIPHFFGKYSKVWDQRLKATEKAEAELEKQLGAAEA